MTRRRAVWIFFTFLVLYVALTRGHFVGTDEVALYQTTRSLWERGTFAISPINNTFEGRGGLTYSQYSPGQSLAAVPLYAIGRATDNVLSRKKNFRLAGALAGPGIGTEPTKWGGDVEIFFVNLFNCFVTAAICAVFFIFCVALGATQRIALFTTLLLGLTSYIAPFSAGFLQHSSEAFFLLLSLYLLFRDSSRTDSRYRIAAGCAVGVMLLFRLQSIVAIPALGIYLLESLRRRRQPMAMGAVEFGLPIVVAMGLHAAVNYIKFGALTGRYNNEGFHTPLFKSLYGFLLSTGDSIFIFTPLLLLAPWTFNHFRKRNGAEAAVILGLAGTYLVFYAKYTAWHGLWSAIGPRYLVPIIPLLLIPIATWIQDKSTRAMIAVVPLAIVGAWVQLVHFAVNFAFVYNHEKWPAFKPEFDFLFVPSFSPIAAFSRAFLAGDFRVDMWLVNIHRYFGNAMLAAFLIPLIILFALCGWQLSRSFREEI